nr:hypothetical protein [Sahlingia subintegra]
MFIPKTFFPLSIQKFLSIKRKTKRVIYTEISHKIKLASCLMIVIIYKPMTIYLIIFYIFFLLLIYKKLYSTNYILYNNLSNNLIIIKFIFLILIFTLGKHKILNINSNNIFSSVNLNILVNLNRHSIILKQKKINVFINILTEQFLKSIYRIEITSITSIIISRLLFISIKPQTILYLLKKSLMDISIYSELNLIFTFASQIYFLISDQTAKMLTALKLKSSNNQWNSLIFHNKILEFFFLYSIRKKQQLKREVMISAQLNSNTSTKAMYTEVELNKLLNHTNTILATFIILINVFLICA